MHPGGAACHVPQSAVPGSLEESPPWSTVPAPSRGAGGISARTVDYVEIVLRAVQRCERPDSGGYFRCDNLSIDKETGLDPTRRRDPRVLVDPTHLIEAIPSWGNRRPSLSGIRRVVADRPRLWNEMGSVQPWGPNHQGGLTIKDGLPLRGTAGVSAIQFGPHGGAAAGCRVTPQTWDAWAIRPKP